MVLYNNKLPYDYFVVFLFSMTLIIITIIQICSIAITTFQEESSPKNFLSSCMTKRN